MAQIAANEIDKIGVVAELRRVTAGPLPFEPGEWQDPSDAFDKKLSTVTVSEGGKETSLSAATAGIDVEP